MTVPRRCLVAVVAACALVLAACSTSTSTSTSAPDDNVVVDDAAVFQSGTTMDKLHQAGKITIGVRFDQPGSGYKDPSTNELTGFDIEIAKIISGKLGIRPEKIRWVETVSKDREKFLRNGTVDLVVASYSITDERRKIVGQAGPYYTTGQQLLVRKHDMSITGPQELANKKVCSAAGTTSIQRIKDKYGVTAIPYSSYSDCVQAVLNRSVDAATSDGAILLGYVGQHPKDLRVVGEPFSTERYGVGYHKGDTAMCEFLNDTLSNSFRNGTWDNALFDTLWKTSRSVPDHPLLDPCS